MRSQENLYSSSRKPWSRIRNSLAPKITRCDSSLFGKLGLKPSFYSQNQEGCCLQVTPLALQEEKIKGTRRRLSSHNLTNRHNSQRTGGGLRVSQKTAHLQKGSRITLCRVRREQSQPRQEDYLIPGKVFERDTQSAYSSEWKPANVQNHRQTDQLISAPFFRDTKLKWKGTSKRDHLPLQGFLEHPGAIEGPPNKATF